MSEGAEVVTLGWWRSCIMTVKTICRVQMGFHAKTQQLGQAKIGGSVYLAVDS
jgi:hypothetical protein